MTQTIEEVAKILDFFRSIDCTDDLTWNVDGTNIQFYVLLSDVFQWAAADAEEIDGSDIPSLQQAFDDLESASGHVDAVCYATMLWASRKRRERIQRPLFNKLDNKIKPLFQDIGEPGCGW